MKPAWIGNACLATSWLLGLSYYHQADWLMWSVMVLLGLICMLWLPLPPADRMVALVTGLVVMPSVFIAPWPHKAGPLLLALGFGLHAARVGGRAIGRLGSAAVTAGVVLMAQSLAIVTYRHLTARWADLPDPLTHMLATLARLVGMDAVADGPRLVLYTMREMHPVAATWSLLVDPVAWGFVIAGVLLILLAGTASNRSEPEGCTETALAGHPQATELDPSRRAELREAVSRRGFGHQPGLRGTRSSEGGAWRRLMVPLATCVVVMAAWLPLKVLFLLAVYLHRALRTDYGAELDLVGQFWSPWVHLLLLGPPLLLVWTLGRLPCASVKLTGLPSVDRLARSTVTAMGMVCVGAVSLTMAWLWEPLGSRKGGRVLVDDYHSGQPWPMKEYDTTRTDRPFDTKWYGRDSSYNYYCIYDYCSRFFEMSRQTAPLTDAALAKCDVLILKDPSAAYSAEEKAVVGRFLERGGGVLFLGDHTSVFGSGVHINDFTEQFGFRYRYDCAFGIDSVFDQTYRPPLAPHPIVQHIATMEFATSCTLDVGASRGRAPMLCTGLKSLGADYHSSNFYPQPRNRPTMGWGAFVQMWATRHARGRMVAFGDSTIFSNFCVFEPGKSQLMLGMIEWLNRANPWMGWRWLLAVLGAMGVVGGGLVLRRGSAAGSSRQTDGGESVGPCDPVGAWGRSWSLLLSVVLLGWALGVIATREVHRRSFPLPRPVRPMVMVAIDRTVSDARLPKNGFISGGTAGAASRYSTEFGQLERCILRLGCFFQRAAGEAATEADLIVVPFPNEQDQNLVRAYGDRLVEYVRNGGRLLVLDGPENLSSRANSLLYRFGIGVKRTDRPMQGAAQSKRPLTVRDAWAAPKVNGALEVTGGTPFAWLEGRPAAAWKSYGQGVVCAVGFGARFRDDQMGPGADVEPQGELKDVYAFLFKLIPAVAASRLPAEGAALVTVAPPQPSTAPSPGREQVARDTRQSAGLANLPFPRGWWTNPVLRAQIVTNPIYRAWYSNYLQRARNATNQAWGGSGAGNPGDSGSRAPASATNLAPANTPSKPF